MNLMSIIAGWNIATNNLISKIKECIGLSKLNKKKQPQSILALLLIFAKPTAYYIRFDKLIWEMKRIQVECKVIYVLKNPYGQMLLKSKLYTNDKHVVSNYRPLLLISSIAKIFEKIIYR